MERPPISRFSRIGIEGRAARGGNPEASRKGRQGAKDQGNKKRESHKGAQRSTKRAKDDGFLHYQFARIGNRFFAPIASDGIPIGSWSAPLPEAIGGSRKEGGEAIGSTKRAAENLELESLAFTRV